MKTAGIIFLSPGQVTEAEATLPEPTPRDIVIDTEDLSVAYATIIGPEDQAGDNYRYMHSIVATATLTDRLSAVLQSDLGWGDDESPVGNQDAEWYGVNSYLFYTLNDCWTAGTRLEWFRDDDGSRISNFAGNFWEISAGLNYKPAANYIFRSELRWDWFNGENVVNPGLEPFDDNSDEDQFLWVNDFIILY